LRGLGGRAEAALAGIDPRKLFALAATASGLLLIAWQSKLSFMADDWDFLLNRRGLSLDVLLRPHVDHIVVGPVAVYKAIQSTIGMEKLFPYALVSTAFFLASVVVLFIYLRRRAGAFSVRRPRQRGSPLIGLSLQRSISPRFRFSRCRRLPAARHSSSPGPAGDPSRTEAA
jgi:hypothetical protein